ncbi:hypothetical protein NAI32_10250, partial [Francisella tularensis subsp. holarctica]
RFSLNIFLSATILYSKSLYKQLSSKTVVELYLRTSMAISLASTPFCINAFYFSTTLSLLSQILIPGALFSLG